MADRAEMGRDKGKNESEYRRKGGSSSGLKVVNVFHSIIASANVGDWGCRTAEMYLDGHAFGYRRVAQAILRELHHRIIGR